MSFFRRCVGEFATWQRRCCNDSRSFLRRRVARVIRVHLVGMVTEIRLGCAALVAGRVTLVLSVVRVALVRMVAQVRFSSGARVPLLVRHL